MKNKIFISIFFVFLMLCLSFTTVVNAQSQEKISNNLKKINNYSNGYILSTNINDEDNPGGWVTNTYTYLTVLITDIQIIVNSRGICKDTFNTLLDIFNLIRSLKESNRLLEYVNVIINQFIPIVQDIIIEIQTIIGLVQAVSDLIETSDKFVTYIGEEPWSAPVIIRGMITGEEGPLEALVTSHGVSFNTNSSGFYYIELESFQDYLPSTYDVVASAEGYSDREKSTGLLFPDGVTTLDLDMDDEKANSKNSINLFWILRHFNIRLNDFLSEIFNF